MAKKSKDKTGAEHARWNLDCFYKGIDDPQLDADVTKIRGMIKTFHDSYKGQLSTKLGSAIADYTLIRMLYCKIYCFLSFKSSLDVADSVVNGKFQDIEKILAAVRTEYMTFFDFEAVALDDETIIRLAEADSVVAKHRSLIDEMRRDKEYLLSEEVEKALAKRSQFDSSTWSDFFKVMEANLKFSFRGKQRTLDEMLNFLTEHHSADVRAKALKMVNDRLGGIFSRYSAQTLNVIAGKKAVEDKDRGYSHPMSARNKSNDVSDAAVDALHVAVELSAGPLVKRYYRLKAALLGIPTLRWSDRLAPIQLLTGGKTKTTLFDKALDLVVDGYESFSPTLAELIRGMAGDGRIDAPALPNKRSGGYSSSFLLPGFQPISFILMNYHGNDRDVMTLAHELGHSVHGLLAGEAQGPLMLHAPVAFSETASTFGEILVFDYLKSKIIKTGDKKRILDLILHRINEIMNTSVRQICFSNFERRVHGAGRWLSVEELDAIWLETTKAIYGEEGEIFTHEDTSHLWSYIPHFHRPFYVYGYAFAELLTHSLYARRQVLGPDFEPLYLDFLRAGGSKPTKELLEPFDLNPEDPDFWARGIKISMGALIEEAEELCRELGFRVPSDPSLLLPENTL